FNSLYKPNLRSGEPSGFASSGFDFVLVYPGLLPTKQALAFPINTFKTSVGVNKYSTAANWLQLADVECGNGKGLNGKLVYLDGNGTTVTSEDVSMPDCMRFDFAAHDDKIAKGRLV